MKQNYYSGSKGVVLIYIVLLIGVTLLFWIKYSVRQESRRLDNVEEAIKRTSENVHVLEAELAYLTRPEHIDTLARLYLRLEPIRKEHVVDISSVMSESNGK